MNPDGVKVYVVMKEQINKLKHENEMLKNRCSALTDGTMCMFCPYVCENRKKEFRGKQENGEKNTNKSNKG